MAKLAVHSELLAEVFLSEFTNEFRLIYERTARLRQRLPPLKYPAKEEIMIISWDEQFINY